MSARRRRKAGPRVRPAEEDDAEELSGFCCSTGESYEDEVEAFLRNRALKRAGSGSVPIYELLVVEEDDRLIGCAGHHEEAIFPMVDESALRTTRLQLLAVRLDQRGRRLDDGSRLADFIFESVLLDAFGSDGGGVLNALIARQNWRSIIVCERNGLRTQTPYDNRLVRLTGTFQIT